MLLAAPSDRAVLLTDLATFYGVHPSLFRAMSDATLERAWRVTQMHASWHLDPAS